MYEGRDPNRFRTERVYNRTDRVITARFDGLDEVWQPQEERWVPQAIAMHVRKRTIVLEDPTTNREESALVILSKDEPLPPLLTEEMLSRKESLLREALEPKTDNAGHVLRAEIMNIHPDQREMRGIAPSQSRAARVASGEILRTDEDFHEGFEKSGAHEMFAEAAKSVPDAMLAPARG